MRLIDADALEKDYRSQFESVYKNIRDAVLPSDFYIERKEAYNKKLMKMLMEAFFEYLQGRPSVDADTYFNAVDRIKPCPKCRYQIFGAEPVRHGRWIHDINNLYGCSECLARETMSHKNLKNFCPECGAKMYEEKESE